MISAGTGILVRMERTVIMETEPARVRPIRQKAVCLECSVVRASKPQLLTGMSPANGRKSEPIPFHEPRRSR